MTHDRSTTNQDYPDFSNKSCSLLRKHLTPKIFSRLKPVSTTRGFTLNHAIASGIKNPDSAIGIYAGDHESYDLFAPIFDPIIEDYHGITAAAIHETDLTPMNLPDLDPKGEFILSTRIRIARNLCKFAFPPFIAPKERYQVEKLGCKAFRTLPPTMRGNYYSLEKLDKKRSRRLIRQHMLFGKGDRFMEAAGINRDWPQGRGIYLADDQRFLIWINEEDHFRIISMESGGNLSSVFNRIGGAVTHLSEKLSFARHDRYGCLTSCPTNLGTGMRAGVHIRLSNLDRHQDLLKKTAEKFHLQIRGTHGEKTRVEKGIYDISNRQRLGITEKQCVQTLYQGISAILALEKN